MAINQVTQGNSPKDLNVSRFRSVLDQGGSMAKGCRFMVVISAPVAIKSYPKELNYLCEAADFPGRGFGITQARYYGPAQAFPNNSEYQPLSLTFLCRADSAERRFFDDWQEFINPTNNFNFEYPNNYYSEIDVYQYSEWGEGGQKDYKPHLTYHWKLHKAWPTLVNEQAVNWSEQDILRLQVTFAYKYWDRPQLQ